MHFLAFVAAGVQVLKLVKDVLDDLRNAPSRELQALEGRVELAVVQIPSRELQRRRMDCLFEAGGDPDELGGEGQRRAPDRVRWGRRRKP